jgi:hypothetical protein
MQRAPGSTGLPGGGTCETTMPSPSVVAVNPTRASVRAASRRLRPITSGAPTSSHVASPARPSQTDVRESHYPDSLYLLISLDPAEADATGAPGVRAWRIVDGGVHEVELTIDA